MKVSAFDVSFTSGSEMGKRERWQIQVLFTAVVHRFNGSFTQHRNERKLCCRGREVENRREFHFEGLISICFAFSASH